MPRHSFSFIYLALGIGIGIGLRLIAFRNADAIAARLPNEVSLRGSPEIVILFGLVSASGIENVWGSRMALTVGLYPGDQPSRRAIHIPVVVMRVLSAAVVSIGFDIRGSLRPVASATEVGCGMLYESWMSIVVFDRCAMTG